ncbi:hypothetical protein FNO01nite_32450 [Flavobacterium noncentrifugens]|uniref:hypothetical protein n=1 Tax=Flavobacterium noncentrifugens TaxID=1128970 RepID=UPI001113A533|nr:hypothetical protein [Flavobacterium noncentrifugens]GEP52573.1 hypothetical protein FNO01nite_32450 [Flavobacterium noncentrifugens]
MNQLTTLDLSGIPTLKKLYADSNLLTSIDLSPVPELNDLTLSTNLLTAIDFSAVPNIDALMLEHNQLTNLDLSNLSQLQQASLAYNSLEYLFMKNGSYIPSTFSLSYNPNLKYICCDESNLTGYKNKVNSLGYSNCEVNSYCSFNPGGAYFTLSGNNHYDYDSNGCNITDEPFKSLKFRISSGNQTTDYAVADASGNYRIPDSKGNYMIVPIVENPNFYSVSPASVNISFPSEINILEQNFCIIRNGIHNDLEVTILPTNVARHFKLKIYQKIMIFFNFLQPCRNVRLFLLT